MIVMAIDRKTLSIVQFPRLIGRMESANHSLSYTIPQFFPARGRALNNMAAGMEVAELN